ncbi:MAG: ATP synthase F1 subunit epsilon [Oligoflexia bacterium]|nr:ATP synthase F1 subunit epsilon [Oligoflexia bacterium]
MALSLSLVTPSKKVFTDLEVSEVFVPSTRGELNILETHGPLMSNLDTGILKYKKTGDTQFSEFAISWGYLEISQDRVTVLAETAEAPSEIDLARAELARDAALNKLASADTEQSDFFKYQLKLQRALVRIKLAESSAALTADKRASESQKTH